MTRILVVTSWQVNEYFDTTTDEQLHKVALFVLKCRSKANWYRKPNPVSSLDFSEGDLEDLPESLRYQAETKLLYHQRAVQDYEKGLAEIADIKRAIEDEDGALAFEVLQARSSRHAHEAIRLMQCTEPE